MLNEAYPPKKRFLSFSYKLILSFLLFTLVSVSLFGYVAYTNSVRSSNEQTVQNITGILQQMQDNVMFKIKEIERVSDQLYWDYTFQDNLRRYEGGFYSYDTTIKYIIPKLNNVINLTPSKILLSVYLRNTTMPEVYDVPNPVNDPLAIEKRFALYHTDRLESLDWYQENKALEEKLDGTLAWKQVDTDRKFGNISILRSLNDVVYYKSMGFMRIVAKLSDLCSSVESGKIGEASQIVVLDGQERPIYASGTNAPLQTSWSDQLKDEHLIIKQELPELNWTLVALIPHTLLEKDANKLRFFTIVVAVIDIFFVGLLGIFIARYFAKRVTKIVKFLHVFREGEFHRRIRFKGNDEFTQISAALNGMGENIERLIEEVYASNLQKKEAELASLQSQINPHFLYNTLSSISRLAKFGEINKLHEMVMGLAKFYRLTLNRGKTIISIADEIQQVEAYVGIQKIKFEDSLEVRFDIDPEVLEYDTIKIVIQPFIENALKHAWFGERIYIGVVACLEGDSIVFKIIDDGVGMTPETIEQIWNSNESQVGYGIYNVHQRIRLQFGEPYGVTIHSGLGIGTTIRIVIPMHKQKPQ